MEGLAENCSSRLIIEKQNNQEIFTILDKQEWHTETVPLSITYNEAVTRDLTKPCTEGVLFIYS